MAAFGGDTAHAVPCWPPAASCTVTDGFAYNPLVFVENWRQAAPELCGTYMTIGDSKVPVSEVGYSSAAQSGYRAWLDAISASVMPQPVSDESQSEGALRPATPFPGERRRQEQVDQRHDPIECCRRITGGNQPWLSTLVCSSRQRRRLRARLRLLHPPGNGQRPQHPG